MCFCFALRARGSRPTGDMGRAERAVHLGHLVVVDDLWARRLASPERLGANDAVPERRASGGCHLATSTFRSTLGGLTVASWLTLSAGATSGARRRARVSGWSSESGPGSVRLPHSAAYSVCFVAFGVIIPAAAALGLDAARPPGVRTGAVLGAVAAVVGLVAVLRRKGLSRHRAGRPSRRPSI